MNFAAILESVKLFFSLLPIILEAMHQAEALFGKDSPGAQKLEIVRIAIEAAYAKEQSVVAPFEQIWPTLAMLIGSLKRSTIFTPATPAA
jgi:hypothetical protein